MSLKYLGATHLPFNLYIIESLIRVIEVGAVLLENGQIVDTFQELCNPGVKLSSFITQFTGITNEMLVGKPSTEEVMQRLHLFIGNKPIVAHNAAFDSKFLISEMKRIKKDVTNTFLCTLLLSRRLIQGLASYKLSFLKTHLCYKADASHRDHRALDDVLVTVHLWNQLHNILCQQHITVSTDFLVTISKLPKDSVWKHIESYTKKLSGEKNKTFVAALPMNYKSPMKKRKQEFEEITDDMKDSPFSTNVAMLRKSPRLIKESSGRNPVVIDLTQTPSTERNKEKNNCQSSHSNKVNSKVSSNGKHRKYHNHSTRRKVSKLLSIFRKC